MDINNLLRYDKNQKYCLWDVESTCLNTVFDNYPWQIGFTIATKDKILEENMLYIKWPKDVFKMSEGAYQVTRFWEHEALIERDGLDPLDALNRFEKYLLDPQYISVCHNSHNFDVGVHSIWRRAVGLPVDYSYIEQALDTNALARAYKLGATIPKDRQDLQSLMWQMVGLGRTRGIKTSVSALCKEWDIPYDPNAAHDAAQDNRYVWEILKQLIWKMEI